MFKGLSLGSYSGGTLVRACRDDCREAASSKPDDTMV
jgi:hypothetical protein